MAILWSPSLFPLSLPPSLRCPSLLPLSLPLSLPPPSLPPSLPSPSLPPFLPHSHRPLHGPLFLLDLVLDEEGAHYSSDPDDFKTTLLAVFDRGVLTTHSVPQIDKVTAVFHFEKGGQNDSVVIKGRRHELPFVHNGSWIPFKGREGQQSSRGDVMTSRPRIVSMRVLLSFQWPPLLTKAKELWAYMYIHTFCTTGDL